MSDDNNDTLDLKNTEDRALLHDKAQQKSAIRSSGLATAAGSALLAGVQTLFITPDVVRQFKTSEGGFWQKLGKNKLGVALAAAPLIVAPLGYLYGTYQASKEIDKKAAELAKIEAKEQAAAAKKAPEPEASAITNDNAPNRKTDWSQEPRNQPGRRSGRAIA